MLRSCLQNGYLASLILTAIALSGFLPKAVGQEQIETAPDSPVESVLKAEAEIELVRSHQTLDSQNVSIRAWRRLKAIPVSDVDADLKRRIDADLLPLEEFFGTHNLEIANFYLSRTDGGVKGARDRLMQIVQEYPDFSGMDEVLMRLSDVSIRSEDPDEARNYLRKLLCKYPGSIHTSQAFARLNEIGYGEWRGCEN